ncbi:hypothetical protein [Nocardia yamanashiensis]|uniref:hypothetical protein n=1 Tax=Nocardia yamanashiensis TaxID=209247 RepID=UPI00082DB968|nr:hypothetical protein [Nocardia yamanashiensis]
MRKVITGVLTTAATAAISLGAVVAAAPAHAETYPGACLVVQNYSGRTVEVTLEYPARKGVWTFSPGEVSVLTNHDVVVTTPGGYWKTHTNVQVADSWNYEWDRNNSKGCNGSWVLTLN